MPDVTLASFVTDDPTAYDSTIVGTAVSTATVSSEPCFFKGFLVNNRVASGSVTIYDSIGTSTNVVGTIVMGTQTFSDPPPLYEFDRVMKNALTITTSANMGIVAFYK